MTTATLPEIRSGLTASAGKLRDLLAVNGPLAPTVVAALADTVLELAGALDAVLARLELPAAAAPMARPPIAYITRTEATHLGYRDTVDHISIGGEHVVILPDSAETPLPVVIGVPPAEHVHDEFCALGCNR